MDADPLQKSLRVRSGQLVIGLHGRSSHPLDCQLRSEIQLSKEVNPPQEGGTGMTMRKQKGQGAASNHAITENMRHERGSTPLVSQGRYIHPLYGLSQRRTSSIRKAEQHADKGLRPKNVIASATVPVLS